MRRKEANRKQRKARWIRVKNEMRQYSDCNYGDFFCHHYLENREDDGPVWADFRFFHSKLKRYFAVAMITAEYEALNIAEGRAIDEAYEEYPLGDGPIFVPSVDHPGYLELVSTETDKKRSHRTNDLLEQYLKLEYSIIPRIEVLNYGDVAVGVYVTVNKSKIDEHVIREFIARFRELGEPIKPGWKWEDEAITITPEQLSRFSRVKSNECGADSSA